MICTKERKTERRGEKTKNGGGLADDTNTHTHTKKKKKKEKEKKKMSN